MSGTVDRTEVARIARSLNPKHLFFGGQRPLELLGAFRVLGSQLFHRVFGFRCLGCVLWANVRGQA